ncbi:hypothetical protein CRN76_17285 [Chryseobacterium indologenes]|uniref:TonB C-terminal domain-containing protein n=1 Tax=Chryseobacterium indologenes TaxID=253 RepID=A0AAD1DVH9_CHRID|nr:hypothetical protein [Chryseobacterium indologenes]ASE63128.1 hypothetical protein CEQ15_17340 [Chryseobacterium indologenes]ATN07036.1 hypothetical protein CRN76_17285 [Chryseobacterium indologenes]AYY84217.1 hypothetical protein EGX91_06505 [Chryseobacterium indologenes]AZB18835.1 hypothetical protein EG352_14120 [Chryseobacterium indologenes]QIX81165.1 hypothetical protein FOB56_07950 [Chryseobacterium indologenes]
MNKKLLTIVLSIFSLFVISAQRKEIGDYPPGQNAYKGGNVQMFKDIQDVFVKNNMSGCENKKEMYWVTLRIDENSKPALVRKKTDIEKAEKNKCAYNLIVKALGQLRNWQPAEINEKKVTAYFDFPFFPSDFFENFKENYDTGNFISRASFPPNNGVLSFSDEVRKNVEGYVDFDAYKINGKFTVFFTVETDGSTKVRDIEPKVANSEQLMEEIRFAFKKVKQKWIPATKNGIPVQTNLRIVLNFGNGY